MSGREKRQRTAATAPIPGSAPLKKQKKSRSKPVVSSPSPPHPHGDIDLDKEYRIRSILKETKTRYLIDWEDDEVTGEKYAQTWEPKENANEQAVDDWERQKFKTRESGSPSKVTTPARPSGRSRKIIDSSPPTSTGQVKNSVQKPVQELPATDPIIIESPQSGNLSEQDPSNQSGSPLFFPDTSQVQHPIVDIGEPPSSILAGAYQEAFTSQVEPSSVPEASVAEEVESFQSPEIPAVAITPLPQLQSVPLNFSSTAVIPDSQTLIEPISTYKALNTFSSLPAGQIETAIFPTSPAPATPPTPSVREEEPQKEQSPAPTPQVTQSAVDFSQNFDDQSSSLRTVLPSEAEGLSDEVITSGVATVQTNGVQSARSTPEIDNASKDPSATNGECIQTFGRTENPVGREDILAISTTQHHLPRPTLDGQNSSPVLAEPSSYIPQSERSVRPNHLAASPTAAGHQEDESGLTQESQHSRHTLADQNQEAQHESTRELEQAFQISPDKGISSLTTPSSPFAFQTQLQPPASTRKSSSSSPTLTSQSAAPLEVLNLLGTAFTEPPQRSQSPIVTSSPLVPVPSQLLTLGESAPRRLTTPSSPLDSSSAKAYAMDTEPAELTPTEKLAQRLKAIREGSSSVASSTRHERSPHLPEHPTRKAGTDATPIDASMMDPVTRPLNVPSTRVMINETRRSPSVVPALRPEALITTEEMNTSERFETLIPQVSEDRNPISQEKSFTKKSSALARPSLDVNDEAEITHVIPIGLLPGQRDQYRQMVFYHQDMIHSFINTSSPGEELLAQASKFVEGVRNVTLHPDLENPETMTQIDVSPCHQAQWDIDCSTKCRFLKHLVECLQDLTIHVAIVCRPGRIVMILNTFLAAINAPFRSRPDIHRDESEHEGLTVEIISTDDKNAPAAEAATPDLVIIMEPTITKDDIHQTHILTPTIGRVLPAIITLLVPGSVEHVAWSLAGGLSDYTRLRSLVGGIYKFRKEVGKLQDDQLPIEEAARAISEYMRTSVSTGSPPTAWPLSDVSTLQDLDSQTDSEPNSNGSVNFEGYSSPTSNKRVLEDDDAPAASKRARLEETSPTSAQLPTTIDPREIDLTHISDSIEKSSGIAQPLSINELHLQALLQDAQARVEEHVEALRVLQYDHEELRGALHKMTTERNEAIVTAQKAVARLTENSTKVAELRAETRELRSQIDNANVKLQHHSVPEQAEFQRIRIEVEVAKQELQKAEARMEIHKNDLAYAQEMYQKASSEAQAAHVAKAELAKQLDVARSRATEEQARLKQIGQDEQTRYLRNEVKKLKSIIHERETSLKLRDEELSKMKEASRGRMGTRGVSVPRSPRLGSPMKFDRGGLSRQSSPAGVEVRSRVGPHLHPLRNV